MNAFERTLLLYLMDDASLSEDSTISLPQDKACAPSLASGELIPLLMLLQALAACCPVTDADPLDTVLAVLAAVLVWMKHSDL